MSGETLTKMETSPAPPKNQDYPLPGIYLKSYGYGYGLVLVKYDEDEEELLAIKLTGKHFLISITALL